MSIMPIKGSAMAEPMLNLSKTPTSNSHVKRFMAPMIASRLAPGEPSKKSPARLEPCRAFL
jgi:hypothetical protein